MTDLRTAAQQALEALEEATSYTSCPTWSPSMTEECKAAASALRAALAEPVEYAVEPNGKRSPLLTHMMNKRTKEDTTLAEPEQEPVAWIDAPEQIWLQVCEDDHCEVSFHEHEHTVSWCATKQNPLDVPYVRADFAAPPQRKPLTEEEIDELSRTMVKGDRSVNWLCRAIERAHGIGGSDA